MENLTRESIYRAIQKIDQNPELLKGSESIMYDLVFNNKNYPPILVLSEANKIEGGRELLLHDFGNNEIKAFEIIKALGFNIIEKESFYKVLIKFLDQSKTTNLTYSNYKNDYLGLKVRVSFGQGVVARIPWISFLAINQSTKNGIYPVYLLYKSINKLILSYGVSETNLPKIKWRLPDNVLKIKDYFKLNNLGKPERYGDSYVFKVYDSNGLPSENILNTDLNSIILEYKKIIEINSVIEIDKEIVSEIFSEPISDKKLKVNFSLNEINKAILLSGLVYSELIINRLISSLLTKPFLILSGLSGSGKTKLAQAFVYWICENENQYKIVPVGADWTNREPLLGYPNALHQTQYIKPDNGVVDLMIHARDNQNLPHFLILDEMNLSHVERYFADFLSAMESGGKISFHSGKNPKDGIPPSIVIPDNLFIIGTINVDETTYMFSPKVLDRANVIEFRISNTEMEKFLKNPLKPNLKELTGKGYEKAESFMELARKLDLNNASVNSINEKLIEFFTELKKTGAEFGYRSAYEIHRLINQLSVIEPGLNEDEKLDIAIMQKLLPKLHGSRRKLCPVLQTLGEFCVISGKFKDIEKEIFMKEDFDYNQESVKFPLSLEKLSRMFNSAVDNGFASYAEA